MSEKQYTPEELKTLQDHAHEVIILLMRHGNASGIEMLKIHADKALEKLNGGIKANCEPTIEPAKYECFGKLVWKWIKENPEFLGDEFSLTLMPMAENSGLCKHEVYDPEKHGEMEGLVPGEDGIYWWGEV